MLNIFRIIFVILCINLCGCLEWANRTFSDDGSLSQAEYVVSIENGYAVFVTQHTYESDIPILFRSIRTAVAYGIGDFAGLERVTEALMAPIEDIRYGNWISNDTSNGWLDVNDIHSGDFNTRESYSYPNEWSLETWDPWIYEFLSPEDGEPQSAYFEAIIPAPPLQTNGIAVAIDAGSSWKISTKDMLNGRKTPNFWCHLKDDSVSLGYCMPWTDIWFDEIKRAFICFAIHEKTAIKRPCPFGAMPSFGFDAVLSEGVNMYAGY